MQTRRFGALAAALLLSLVAACAGRDPTPMHSYPGVPTDSIPCSRDSVRPIPPCPLEPATPAPGESR